MPHTKRKFPHNRVANAERSSGMSKMQRRYPVQAELIGEGRTHFRVWAPGAKQLEVVLEGEWVNSRGASSTGSGQAQAPPTFQELEREAKGYFSGVINGGAGMLYRFRVDGAENYHPDPASRFQPEGPHGSSCVVDPTQFRWTDGDWKGIQMPGQIIYEMHLGTFTCEGTWPAAARDLGELARLGIT